MKPELTALFGQAPEFSTSFQTGELCRHLARWFTVHRIESPSAKSPVYQTGRFWRNFLKPAISRPKVELLLYGNDGFADLRHWRGRRILYWYDAPEDWSLKPPKDFKNRLRCENVRIADDVFAVSAAQTRLAMALRPGREKSVHYLPVGVDCEFFDPSKADRAGARDRFGFKAEQVAVGYLGYLGRWRDRFAGEALIEAAQRLRNSHLRFLIMGAGPALPDWRRKIQSLQIEHLFTFAGFIQSSALPDALAATDICVDTLEPGFHSEARSETKLKQYMAMGRACIATDIGENRVDLDQGRAGRLVPPKPEALADTILHLARDPSERERLGQKARARALEAYDWRHLAQKMAMTLRGTAKP